jgi:hypothetical protein
MMVGLLFCSRRRKRNMALLTFLRLDEAFFKLCLAEVASPDEA